MDQAESIGRQLNNYISYLKHSKQGEKDLPAGYATHEESGTYQFDNLDEDSPIHQP